MATSSKAASAPNTPTSYYMDSNSDASKCKKDRKQMEQKCAPDNEHKHRGKGRPKARDDLKTKPKEGDWVLDHCGPLLVQPGLENFKEWYSEFGDITSALSQAREALQSTVIAKVEQRILEYTGEKMAKLAIRRGLTGWIPIVGWVLSAVDVVVTATQVAGQVAEMRQTVADLKGTVERMKEAGDKITGTLKDFEKELKGFDQLSDKERTRVANTVMADVQSAYAAASPCLRARKCMLVPYSKKTAAKWAGSGCCPGQTGHHLLPDAMFRDNGDAAKKVKEAWEKDPANLKKDGEIAPIPRDKIPTKKCWTSYTEDGAPTICVEGNNQHMGSHGAMHKLTQLKLDAGRYRGKSEMPYGDARDLLLGEISRMYGCDIECLKEQLDNYYCKTANACVDPTRPEKSCHDTPVNPHDGTGAQPKEKPDAAPDAQPKTTTPAKKGKGSKK